MFTSLTTNIKGLAALLAVALIFAPAAQAQTSASESVGVSVEVVDGLSFSNGNSLDFGRIAQSEGNVTLTPTSGSVSAGDQNVTVGSFNLSGAASEAVEITYPSNVTLSHSSSSASVSFSPSVTSNSSNNQGSANSVSDGGSISLSSTGARYFWLGGTVNIGNGQQTGNYQGTFVIQAQYINL